MEWYMWLGIGYLACMLISAIYLLIYIYIIYPKILKRKVGISDVYILRISDVYILRIISVILIQPIGLLLIIIDTIVDIKKRGKENGKVTNG